MRHQVELLVDHADAEIARGARAADLHGLAVETNLARVPAIGAAKNLHQRRLPGPFRPERHVSAARLEHEIDAVERDDAGKLLADAAHLERGGAGGGHGTLTSNGAPPTGTAA